MASIPIRALLLTSCACGLLAGLLLVRLPSQANPGSSGGAGPASSSSAAAALVNPPASTAGSLPTLPGLPTAPDGRHYPLVPDDAAATAALLSQVEEALRSPATAEADLPALGHQQQVIYRVLAHQPEQMLRVRAALPERWQARHALGPAEARDPDRHSRDDPSTLELIDFRFRQFDPDGIERRQLLDLRLRLNDIGGDHGNAAGKLWRLALVERHEFEMRQAADPDRVDIDGRDAGFDRERLILRDDEH